jgi:pimeloyl-ACP methyl ester carboxylesterase
MTLGHTLSLVTDRIVEPIEEMHLTISNGWFSATGFSGEPARRVHDTVLNGIYGSVRMGASILGKVISHRVPVDSPISLTGQAIVNGLWGDDLGPFASDLEISMEIRGSAGDVVSDEFGTRRLPAQATPHLVVLAHGLFESEICWHGDEDDPSLMDALESRLHLTVLSARYNSGRRVRDNGEQLASMLDDLTAEWPVDIESIALVGSSMGGLLIRSACASAERQDHEWLGKVGSIVTVATPHRGTPIEKGVDVVASALLFADSTRPLGRFLDSRSEGIKDLRHGAVSVGGHQTASSIDHHVIAAVVSSNPTSPVGALFGDLVVRPASASSRDDQSVTSVTVVGGTNHFKALTSPAVIDRVVECVDFGTRMLDNYEAASS